MPTQLTIGTVRAATVDMPRFGIGTWRMGESNGARKSEETSITLALDHGVTLIDTAEMYGEGKAEEIVGAAIRGRRDGLTIVSKVYPHNASEAGVIAACERSLKRLAIDQIDIYLLHWRGRYPLAETVRGFETLKTQGKIRAWGVSNFDRADMVELAGVPGGTNCATNQVLYHLDERGIEFDLVAHQAKAKIPIMAYSPLGQGSLLKSPALKPIAAKHGVTPAAVALAFVLNNPNVVAIPKSSNPTHFAENLRAVALKLDAEDLKALDRAFPPPKGKSPLAMT